MYVQFNLSLLLIATCASLTSVCFATTCTDAPCQNGGTCVQSSDSYSCTCATGFTGANCQTNINDCTATSCRNGGTCIDGINSYTCICAPGYTGARCLTIINNCVSLPCHNGGTCNNAVNAFTCTCQEGYDGATCDTVLTGACGLTTKPLVLTDGAGNITSLHYPSNYGSKADCQWRIVSSNTGGIVSLQFPDIYITPGDYVYIYDGSDATAPLLVSGSSNALQGGPVYSTQSNMFLKFKAVSTYGGHGFLANYASYGPLPSACSATKPQTFTGSQTFTSQYYPVLYTTNANCEWKLQAATSSSVVRLTFNDFQLAGVTDIVYILDGSTGDSPMIAYLTATSTNLGPFQSTCPFMYLKFLTDTQYSGRGFNATFVSV